MIKEFIFIGGSLNFKRIKFNKFDAPEFYTCGEGFEYRKLSHFDSNGKRTDFYAEFSVKTMIAFLEYNKYIKERFRIGKVKQSEENWTRTYYPYCKMYSWTKETEFPHAARKGFLFNRHY